MAREISQQEHRFMSALSAVAIFRAAPTVDYQRFRSDLDATADQDAMPRA